MLKAAFLLSLFTIINCVNADAQNQLWHRTDSVNGNLKKIVVATDGSIHGIAQGIDSVFALQFDTAGTRQWIASRPGTHATKVNDVITDSAGNTYFCGSYYQINDDAYIIKVDAAGSERWVQTFNYNNAYDGFNGMAIDVDGNILVTGKSVDTSGFPKVLITKFSPTGTVLWYRHYGVSGYYYGGNSVSTDAVGNVFVSTARQSAITNYDVDVVKFDSAGVFQWEQLDTSTGHVEDMTKAMSLNSAGNTYLVGSTYYNNNKGNAYLAKFSADGTGTPWFKTIANSHSFSELSTSVLDEYNNLYVAGYDSGSVAYIARIDTSSGDTLWTIHSGTGAIKDIKYANGALYATGFATNTGTGNDVLVMKVSTGGHILWSDNYSGMLDDNDEGVSIALHDGNIYVGVNTLEMNANDTVFMLIKYQETRVGVFESTASLPFTVSAYPNPTTAQLQFTIELATTGQASMYIYDVNGKQLATVFNQQMQAGKNNAMWDVSWLATGTYLYKMVTPNGETAGKFIKY